jgi:hypothetical protein
VSRKRWKKDHGKGDHGKGDHGKGDHGKGDIHLFYDCKKVDVTFSGLSPFPVLDVTFSGPLFRSTARGRQMKIEFLADGAPECPLVRLFWFKREEIAELRGVLRELAAERLTSYDLHARPWAEPVDGCKLTLERTSRWIGMPLPADRRSFVLQLPAEGWKAVAELVAPFSEPLGIFQWLTDVTDSEVQLLLSWGGEW